MKVGPTPCDNHILRYIGASKIDEGIVNPQGFTGSSVNWMECTPGTEDEQVERIRSLLRLNIGATAKFAKLHVGTVRSLGDLDVESIPLDVGPDGAVAVPCHADITGIPDQPDDYRERVLEAIADSVIGIYDAKKG